MDTVLVIGGTGNIGKAAIDYLSNQPNAHVIAGAHDIARATAVFAEYPRVEVRRFDFLAPETYATALKGVSKVFFVRPPQLSQPKKDMLPFLQYIKSKNIQHLVFVSLIGVEKNPMTPHHTIEKMIVELQLPYTFIRPSFFMQNLSTTHVQDIQERSDLFVPAGKSRTSFIDTRDIGEIAGICLTNTAYIGKKLAITGDVALTYSEIAEIMTKELGRRITYSKPGLLHFRKVMIQRGTPKAYANVMTMLYVITQLGNAQTITSTAADILGRPPRSFASFVRDHRTVFNGSC